MDHILEAPKQQKHNKARHYSYHQHLPLQILSENIPRWHTRAQLRHPHRHTLNKKPTDQPSPDHAPGPRIPHPIVQRTRETGQETQHSERNTERRPERKLALEFLLVAESYESGFVGCETGEVGHVAIGHDGRHGGFAGVEAAAGWMRGVHVRTLASVALYFLHLERPQVLKYGKGLRIAQRGKEREGWKHLLIATYGDCR